MKILVTGSSGTIGTRLCEFLIEKGYEIVGADWKPNIWNKEIDGLTIDVDLRDKEAVLEKLPKNVDLVIHLAANARVYNLVVEPSLARDNFESLFNVLEFSRLNNIKKFMFASSREVYGNSTKKVLSENDSYVKNCESPYTASKIAGEALAHSYSQCYGIDFVLFRFSNVYGRYDNSDRVVPLFIKLCREGKDVEVYGKDKMLDFTYIDDAVDGISRCIDMFDDIKNDTFNIAYGEGSSIIEVAELIKEMLSSSSKINIKENRTGEVVKYVADISKARRVLSYSPKFSITAGLKKSVEWYMEQNQEKSNS